MKKRLKPTTSFVYASILPKVFFVVDDALIEKRNN